MRASLTLLAVAALFPAPTPAQWTDVKTPGIPRLAAANPTFPRQRRAPLTASRT